MKKVSAIATGDGRRIYVEVDEADIADALAAGSGPPADLPEGAEPTGARERVIDAIAALRENIRTMAETVHESLAEHPPAEWSLELSIGFKGKASPVPVILSGETQGSIKVIAKWKRND